MSKLSKEELLYWLSQARWYHPPGDQKERKSNQAYQQIKEMIQKPEVTEEWVEEKANILYEKITELNPSLPTYSFLEIAKDFIRSLVEEISSQQLDKNAG